MVIIMQGIHDVGCNFFIWFDEVEIREAEKETTLEDLNSKLVEIELLLDDKDAKIKEAELKLHEKDIKIARQRKKINKMKEGMLSTKRIMKILCVGWFVSVGLIVMLM
jgi:peptidoglycan hydrolase CwlO-like protein